MVSTSSQVVIRRAVFWLIALIVVAAPVCLYVSAIHSPTEVVTTHTMVKREHFFLFTYMAQIAVVTLAVWCFIFIRQEPRLVRIALVLIVVVSVGFLWLHRL